MKTEKAIREFETYIDSIPEDHVIFYGTSTLSGSDDIEGIIKSECNLPTYWKFMTFTDPNIASAVYQYFSKKGYTLSEAGAAKYYSFSRSRCHFFVFGVHKDQYKTKK